MYNMMYFEKVHFLSYQQWFSFSVKAFKQIDNGILVFLIFPRINLTRKFQKLRISWFFMEPSSRAKTIWFLKLSRGIEMKPWPGMG